MNELFSFIRRYGTDTFHTVISDNHGHPLSKDMSLELREAFRQVVKSPEYQAWLKKADRVMALVDDNWRDSLR